MLGMMNSASDAVEFYATNENRRNGMSDRDLKTFTEAKPRKCITYTKDGRRMIDGKIEDVESGTVMALWGNTILRGAVRTHMKVENLEKDEKSEDVDEDSKEESKKESESTIAEKREHVQIIEIVEHPVLANASSSEQPH
ncbi:hypothetical protein NECAME_12092 [Necator americanus]|uniref:Uncharacterized protein n=1 Tax=Necator americanus TaxID=51031 RepID=W2T1Q3_NECAM|nr:hypothetical protein NECAME_12092 [Necator americanus]ETN75813.1 hypothetical protein NECAME_12092 [Necator americanus]